MFLVFLFSPLTLKLHYLDLQDYIHYLHPPKWLNNYLLDLISKVKESGGLMFIQTLYTTSTCV